MQGTNGNGGGGAAGANSSTSSVGSQMGPRWRRVTSFFKENATKMGLNRSRRSSGATGLAAMQAPPEQSGHLGRVHSNSPTSQLPDGTWSRAESPQPGHDLPGVDALDHSVRFEQQHRLAMYLDADELEVGETTSTGLRGMCWNGCPLQKRAQCWRILCGYEPVTRDRRAPDLARKRAEYRSFVSQYYSSAGALDGGGWMADSVKVIKKDIPRTAPNLPFFQHEKIQSMYERILVIWAHRHPATGYVQGMNDLVTVFVYVFASEGVDKERMLSEKLSNEEMEDILTANADLLDTVESDTYWCFNRLLDHIQDNYTENQPGIQQKLNKYDELLKQVDAQLAAHLEAEGVLPMHYVFRYVNCLFVREFPLPLVARLWDTFLCEQSSFPDLHLYICVALVKGWSKMLIHASFSDLIKFLQSPPTETLVNREIDELIAKAFVLKSLYDESSAVTQA